MSRRTEHGVERSTVSRIPTNSAFLQRCLGTQISGAASKKLTNLAKHLLLFRRYFQKFQAASHSSSVPHNSLYFQKGVLHGKRQLQINVRSNAPAFAGKRSDTALAYVEGVSLDSGFSGLAVDGRSQTCTEQITFIAPLYRRRRKIIWTSTTSPGCHRWAFSPGVHHVFGPIRMSKSSGMY